MFFKFDSDIRIFRQVSTLVRRFRRDEGGSPAILFALVLLPLIAAVGLAIDSGMAFNLKARLQKSIDAAGLAAGRVAYSDHAISDARAYFDSNFPPGYLSSTVTAFDVRFDENRDNIFIDATVEMPTVFMKVFGHDSVTVTASTTIHRENQGMELALVLDVTGSMQGNKIRGLRDAATDLINILYGDSADSSLLWVSLVPYSSMVNVGPGRTNWLDGGDRLFTNPSEWQPSAWKGCVMARGWPFDADDTPPGLGLGRSFESFFYESDNGNNWNQGNRPPDERWQAGNSARGPNLGCGPPITSLTNNKQQILTRIDELRPWSRGGTAGNLGLSWGWRTISPKWKAMWEGQTPDEYPLDYEEPKMQKVVIVLTDGQNQFYRGNGAPRGSDKTAYGRLDDFAAANGQNWNLGDARNELDDRMRETCRNMKAEGITIYSITFGSPDADARALFQECASSAAHYFNSPDNATLASAFQTIGQQLSKLRIAR
jgi:Flp pilus assembly protein TadG